MVSVGKVKFLVTSLSLIFWPLSLFFANNFSDFLRYVAPAVLLGLSFLLLKKRVGFYLLPFFIIPIIEPKLALFPFIATTIFFFLEKNSRNFIFLLLSLVILTFSWKAFWGQTIFQSDYEAQQAVISKSYLYPTVFTARLFQNKLRIYINKFNNNFFAIVDPNNYFFSFHPREIKVDNQNLTKFPFLGIIFTLFGLYYIRKHPSSKFIIAIFVSAIISLSILQIFDRNDFILWLPLSLVIIYGRKVFDEKQKRFQYAFYTLFILFTIPELMRIFVK